MRKQKQFHNEYYSCLIFSKVISSINFFDAFERMHNTTTLKVKAQKYRTFEITKFQYSMELHECNFLQLVFDQNKTSNNKSIRQECNSRSFLSDNLCTFHINQSMLTRLEVIGKKFQFFAHFNC